MLYPMAFADGDAHWLGRLLLERFGLCSTALRNTKGQWLLRIPAASRAPFLAIVAHHAPPGMEYKYAPPIGLTMSLATISIP